MHILRLPNQTTKMKYLISRSLNTTPFDIGNAGVTFIPKELSSGTFQTFDCAGSEFFVEQPTEELNNVYESEVARLKTVVGDIATKFEPIGSTAIKGMPGTAVVDVGILVPAETLPVTEELWEKLATIGYEKGMTKSENEQWVYGGDAPKSSLGRINARLLTDPNQLADYCAFRDYCNTHSEAFEAYKNVKLEKAAITARGEAGYGGYKGGKGGVASEILRRAKEWKESN